MRSCTCGSKNIGRSISDSAPPSDNRTFSFYCCDCGLEGPLSYNLVNAAVKWDSMIRRLKYRSKRSKVQLRRTKVPVHIVAKSLKELLKCIEEGSVGDHELRLNPAEFQEAYAAVALYEIWNAESPK